MTIAISSWAAGDVQSDSDHESRCLLEAHPMGTEVPRWVAGFAVLLVLHLVRRKRESPGLRLLWDVTSVLLAIFGFLQALRQWRLLGAASDHWAIQVTLVVFSIFLIPLLFASLTGLFLQTFRGSRSTPPYSSHQASDKDEHNDVTKLSD